MQNALMSSSEYVIILYLSKTQVTSFTGIQKAGILLESVKVAVRPTEILYTDLFHQYLDRIRR